MRSKWRNLEKSTGKAHLFVRKQLGKVMGQPWFTAMPACGLWSRNGCFEGEPPTDGRKCKTCERIEKTKGRK